jgi:Flp pilus assembly pilin Flp
MLHKLKHFMEDEAGAVTVDWVVLTAAVVGLATALVVELKGGSAEVTENTKTFLENQPVGGGLTLSGETTPD